MSRVFLKLFDLKVGLVKRSDRKTTLRKFMQRSMEFMKRQIKL